MKEMKIDRVRGHLDLLLLGVLEREAGHGYAVITALRERTDGLLDLTEGAVYPALHRLEDLGLLQSEWQQVGGRRRRLYRMTREGRGALRAETRDFRKLVTAVDAVVGPMQVEVAR